MLKGFQKGNKWRFQKGYKVPEKWKKFGEKNFNWKGDKVKRVAIHLWVYRKRGKPKVCEHCGATAKERKLAWANKDHTYKRKLGDYLSLCYSCHKIYDNKAIQ